MLNLIMFALLIAAAKPSLSANPLLRSGGARFAQPEDPFAPLRDSARLHPSVRRDAAVVRAERDCRPVRKDG
jgi:hypothetical protein